MNLKNQIAGKADLVQREHSMDIGEVYYEPLGKVGILSAEHIVSDVDYRVKYTIKFKDGSVVHPRSRNSYFFFIRENERNNSNK